MEKTKFADFALRSCAMLFALVFTGMSHQPQGHNKENPAAGRIVIIGVGNLLLKDEGLGIHVVRELREKALPPGVEVIDGGVAGIGLLDLFQGARKLVLIDAADMNLAPGTVVRFTPEDIRSRAGTPSSRPTRWAYWRFWSWPGPWVNALQR